jgi:transmembrane sensor
LTTEISDQSLREASAWFARLHGDNVSAEDHVSLAQWLAMRPGHREAYEFVTETCRLAAHAQAAANRDLWQTKLPPKRREPAVSRGGKPRGTGAFRGMGTRQALAAGIVAVAIAGITLLLQDRPAARRYETAIGEIRNVALEDGTKLVLSGATTVDVAFDRHSRALKLETGELFIVVGKDPARPLRLRAGDRVIEDVGTAFDVNMHANAVDVAVGEGAVMISRQSATNPADTATLLMGQALTYAFDRPLGAPRSVGSQQVGTWRVGVLTYDQVPLEWLIADLNRQFDGNITITDPQLAAMSVTLTLKLRDRDTTISTLEKLLPIHAVSQHSGAIELVRTKS